MDQIGGSVHRIQNPYGTVKIDLTVILFLPHKLDFRPFLPQPFLQELLYLKVHLGHIIGYPFYGHLSRCFFIGEQRLRFLNQLYQLFHIYCHFFPSLSLPRITQSRRIENILRTF